MSGYYGDTEGETIAVQSESRPGVTHYVSYLAGSAVACTCESFHYRDACKHVDDGPTEYATRAYGRPQPVGPMLTAAERHPMYQQYRAQGPPVGGPADVVRQLGRELMDTGFGSDTLRAGFLEGSEGWSTRERRLVSCSLRLAGRRGSTTTAGPPRRPQSGEQQRPARSST